MVRDTEGHVITTSQWFLSLSLSLPHHASQPIFLSAGLWVIISHAQMLRLRPQRSAEIRVFQKVGRYPRLALVYFFVTSKHL